MNIIKRALTTDKKDISFRRVNRAIVKRITDIPHTISWYLPTKFSKENKSKLLAYKDKHKGKRCFIVANGPSLQKTDLSLLKDEITIGMNRVYLLEEVNGFTPTYLAVSDIEIQLRQFTREYNEVNIPKFFPWEVRKMFQNTTNMNYFKMKFPIMFSPNFQKLIGAGKSVTIVCIQLAYYMGFSEVFLVGKDHSYNHNQNGVPGTRILSNGSETNHFINSYYKKGMKWTLPNYKEEEIAYNYAKEEYEKNGRKIYDATIDGKLTIFEKVKYIELFHK
jgi:hypothetical protein